MTLPSATVSYQKVMKPESAVTIRLNDMTGKVTAQSGRFAGEKDELFGVYQIEITRPALKKFTEEGMRANVLSVEHAMNNGTSFEVTPGSSPDYLKFFEYKGDLTEAQRGQVSVANAVSGERQIYVNTTAVTGNVSGNLITTGDFLQIGSTPFQATSNVAFTSNANVTIPLNRRLFRVIAGAPVGGMAFTDTPTWTVKYESYVPYKMVYNDCFTYKTNTINLVEVVG